MKQMATRVDDVCLSREEYVTRTEHHFSCGFIVGVAFCAAVVLTFLGAMA